LRLGPEVARTHYYLAEVLLQMGDSAGALKHYERAAHLSPRDVEFRLKYGIQLAQKSPKEGAVELREAARLDPKSSEILSALGAALRRSGEAQEASEVFRRSREASAAAARHSEATLETNKAIELLQKGRVPEAIEALRTALAAQPDFAEANHYMGIARSAEKNWMEANRAFSAAVQARPGNPEIHFNFGVALEKQGDWMGAAREFENVVSLRPGQAQAACQMASALLRAGESDRAKTALQRAKELGPCNVSQL
jgi:Tfp pilus assembly protein PilF